MGRVRRSAHRLGASGHAGLLRGGTVFSIYFTRMRSATPTSGAGNAMLLHGVNAQLLDRQQVRDWPSVTRIPRSGYDVISCSARESTFGVGH